MSKIIYTALFGNYDTLQPIKQPGWRCMCFTDQDIQVNGWEIVKTEFEPKIFRKIKICPHLFLPEHTISVWMDANITPFRPMDHIIRNRTGFWIMRHPLRKCVYEEAKRCIELNKDDPETIEYQVELYKKHHHPVNFGMVASGVIIRTANYNNYFNESWWDEVDEYSVRDQLSFNIIAYHTYLKYNTFPYLENFKIVRHAPHRTTELSNTKAPV